MIIFILKLIHQLYILNRIVKSNCINKMLYEYSFKNGSLVRERIRDKCAGGSWDKMAELLSSTHPGNDGNIGKQKHEQISIHIHGHYFT